MNVPKLRFKEFNNKYNITKVSKIIDVIDGDRGNNYPKANDFYDSEFCLFLNAGNVTKNGFNFKNNQFITKEKDKKLRKGKLLINDIVLTTRGTVGNVAWFNEKIPYKNIRINSGMVINRIKEDGYLLPEYLYSYMKSPIFENQVNKMNYGSAQPQLTVSGINKFNIQYPTINEQKKVSTIMLLLDKKIELQSKKIEDLKLFKLCINNDLFNGYKTIKLKDICECKSSPINLSDIDDDNGNGIYPIYGANGEIKKISSYQNEKDYLAIVKDGAGVGRTIICNKKSSIIATLSALIPNDIPVYYFNELISKINFSKYIVGSGIPHIYFKDYSNEKLCLHEEEERVLINNLFKILIIKIELEIKELNKLQELKKGLMQQMFV